MMKKTWKWIKNSFLVGLLTVVVTACYPAKTEVIKNDSKSLLNNVSNLAAITIDSKGVVATTSKLNSKYHLDIWFDPFCPHCIDLHKETHDFIESELKKGDLSVTFHPIAFLDKNTIDNYSTRMSVMIVGVAEYAPDKFQSFINEIMSGSLYPKSEGSQTPDSLVNEIMKKIGVDESTINKIHSAKQTLAEIVTAGTQEFRVTNKVNYLKLASLEGAKNSYTPFIMINKTGEFVNKTFHPTKDGETWLSVLKEKYEEIKK